MGAISSLTEILCELRCLDLGILGREVSLNRDERVIDEIFSKMDPDEARKMKRKFRKVSRQIIKRERWKKLKSRGRRQEVMRDIFVTAWEDALKIRDGQPDNDVP
jgi:hypothetical protein